MTPDKAAGERTGRSLTGSFERYLQDKGKGRGGDGGNYRRNATRELKRFAEWAAGDGGPLSESLELASCVPSVVPAVATAALPLVLEIPLKRTRE